MKRVVSGLLFIVLSGTSAWGGAGSLQYNLGKYLVDPQIARVLDAHVDEVIEEIASVHRKKKSHGVWEFDWLPGYYIKYGLARIWGMEAIQKCITNHNLYFLAVPDKRIYHIKGRPTFISDLNYAVIVKEVEQDHRQWPLTLEHVTQLSTLIEECHYTDLHTHNYIRSKNGKLYLIDTEGIFDRNTHLDGYLKLFCSNYTLSSSFTQRALKFLFHHVEVELQNTPEKAAFCFSKIDKAFSKQKQRPSWNYVAYCNKLLARYRKNL